MRIAIMARVSTAKQDYENQLIQLREFAARQKWEIVAEYCDVVTASGKKERRQFDAMFLAASQKQFDLVLFWSLDRFSREGTLMTLQYLQRLDAYGVGWRSYTEQYIDSCGMFKDVVVSLLATMARQERIQISDRTKAGLRRVRREGTRSGNPIGRPCALVDMAKVAKRRAKGESFRSIASDLGVSAALLCKRVAEAKIHQTEFSRSIRCHIGVMRRVTSHRGPAFAR